MEAGTPSLQVPTLQDECSSRTALITANIYTELGVGLIIFLFPKMSRRLKNVKAPPLNVDTKVTVD